jgi:hypothetical protein
MYADFEDALIRELIPLGLVLALASGLYAAREQRRRRRRIQPVRPDLEMRELSGDPALAEIERTCVAQVDPRVAFRRAAIENAVGELYLEAIAEHGVADIGDALDACRRNVAVLRAYLRLKYDDAVAEDWFDHFVAVGRPYIKEKVRLTREFALHKDEGAERFARIYDDLLRGLVKDALAAPQKKTFVPPDFSHSSS